MSFVNWRNNSCPSVLKPETNKNDINGSYLIGIWWICGREARTNCWITRWLNSWWKCLYKKHQVLEQPLYALVSQWNRTPTYWIYRWWNGRNDRGLNGGWYSLKDSEVVSEVLATSIGSFFIWWIECKHKATYWSDSWQIGRGQGGCNCL
jgi:hypothetical protein